MFLPEGAAVGHDRADQRGLRRLCQPLHESRRPRPEHLAARGPARRLQVVNGVMTRGLFLER